MTESTSVINSPDARPGRLKGGAKIYLHSFYAIRAFQGRAKKESKPRIFGADEFNSRTNLLYRASEADDPFAHYALVQIEKALADEEHELQSDIRSVRKFLNKHSNRIQINDAMSVEPVKFLAYYANYGFQLVDLLVRFDELCQLLLSGAHCNRIPKQDARDWMEKAATRIRPWPFVITHRLKPLLMLISTAGHLIRLPIRVLIRWSALIEPTWLKARQNNIVIQRLCLKRIATDNTREFIIARL